MMDRISARVAALTGMRRIALAAVLGALAALAFAPVFAFPVLFLSFTGLVWLVDGAAAGPRPFRHAFVAGWWFGFAHFCVGLYWIANALLVDAETFGWLVPFAVTGLSLYFALFPALAAVIAVRAHPGAARVIMFAAAWTAAEWMRGVLLTGFPWNLMGSTLAFDPVLLQGAAFVGTYGLSLAVVLIAASPAMLWRPDGGTGRARWAVPGAVLALAVVIVAGGAARLTAAPDPGGAGAPEAPQLRIVQPNVTQELKWRPGQLEQQFENLLHLSWQGGSPPDVVVWPETALPLAYDGDPRVPLALARAAPADGLLITGFLRTTPAGTEPYRAWNSVLAITADGEIVARYDKHHLVPFGEYVPLRSLNPIPRLTEGRGDFSAGPGPRTLVLSGLPPLSPLICYEAIFPGRVTASGEPRPEWLLNVTNDGWFGDSFGPYQHLAAARLRAVEEGAPLVRAANTGVSAIIDPYGRVLQRLPLGTRGVIDATLPAAIPAPTLYARAGNLVLAILLLMAVLAGWLAGRFSKPIKTGT